MGVIRGRLRVSGRVMGVVKARVMGAVVVRVKVRVMGVVVVSVKVRVRVLLTPSNGAFLRVTSFTTPKPPVVSE